MIDREIYYSKKGNSVVAQSYKVGEKSVGKGRTQPSDYLVRRKMPMPIHRWHYSRRCKQLSKLN